MTDPISNERLDEYTTNALDNLRVHQRQLDADGCEVGVSREALNEVIRAFGELSRRQSPAGVEVKGLEWTVSEVFGRRKVRGSGPIGEVCAFTIDDLSDQEIADKKSAYEADYERRILSSLSVKEPEGVEPDPNSPTVIIGYTNWRNEYAEREIIPMRPWFGSTDWHPEPQWLLKAWDVAKDAERDFAIKEVGFKPSPPKAVTITDEMVEPDAWRDVIVAIRDICSQRPSLSSAKTKDEITSVALSNSSDLARIMKRCNELLRSPPPKAVTITEEVRGRIAYALTKRMVIDMPTARAAVDEALSSEAHNGREWE